MNATTAECAGECDRRCSRTHHRKPCLFFCAKCLCVPPGYYGNKETCPCYKTTGRTSAVGPNDLNRLAQLTTLTGPVFSYYWACYLDRFMPFNLFCVYSRSFQASSRCSGQYYGALYSKISSFFF
ncbi:hypothetical protein PR202_ga04149 [Eleusine coracana subsp. coracana]|uniref:Gibberellin regulated protein n=1 Tax=Eleusine coracana subsp. coracana TaxID=191504 RepID=A0AAV5BRK5_ELECO|nr:hypothetical protein PR202_ga04149 [Eleusine coracana subsp. coracana]